MLHRQQLAAIEGVALLIDRPPVVAAAGVPAEQPGVAAQRLRTSLPARLGILQSTSCTECVFQGDPAKDHKCVERQGHTHGVCIQASLH